MAMEQRNCRICRAGCAPLEGNDGTGKVILIRRKTVIICGDCWLRIQEVA